MANSDSEAINQSIKQDNAEYDNWWEQFQSVNINEPGTKYRNNRIKEYIKETGAKTIVDAGCGAGQLIKAIDDRFGRSIILSGFDVSEKIIKQNRQAYPQVSFFCANLNQEMSEKNKYEMVICCEVVEHLRNWENAIKQLSKIIKNEGYLLLSTQSGKVYKHHKDVLHLRHFNKQELEDALKNNNLDIIESYNCGWPFMNLKNILVNLFYKKVKKGVFEVDKQSFFNKMIFKVFGFLYYISSKNRGPQIFILAKKP